MALTTGQETVVITGAVALVGVLVGGLTTALTTGFFERRRERG